jgi:selenocysteine lyase/cysteine desulfurase
VTLDEFLADFSEEPGYLDFAAVGPLSAAVTAEGAALVELLSKARFGTIPSLLGQDERVRDAVARATGFDADSVVFQPNTSTGLMHAMFGLTGTVALSPAEYPSLTFAASRAAEALGVVTPLWLETDHGRVTPGNLRDQLTPTTAAVAVSLVDFRTGYLADLDGIRQVIGDRLLIVDAIQGFGVVDAPYSVADVLVTGGQKWLRAGWGTGFLALSDRALDHLTPVWSGRTGTDVEGLPVDEVPPATKGAPAFSVTVPDPIAQARLATALDLVSEVGIGAISARLAENVSRIIDLADEYALPVVSPRDERERAGIVILEPAPESLTVLTASLHNHGVSATVRGGRVRLAPHVSTNEETFEMLRASLLSYATATGV